VVEKETVREAVNEHCQPMREAVETVLKHSPVHADKTPAEVTLILNQIDLRVAADRQNGAEPKRSQDRGHSL
jgi:hypothetical protein